MQLANLHDAFMNASLQHSRMLKEALENDAEGFMVSDRGRFERSWLTFLYVLVECWKSSSMEAVRDHVRNLVPDCQIDTLIKEGDSSGAIASMREVRHYMCHRDAREYWNTGRIAVAGHVEYNLRLHEEFSRVLLTAMQQHAS